MTENVEVLTLFKDSGLPVPKLFKYGQKVYKIVEVNLTRAIKRGARRILIFDVSDDGGNHTLIFDTETLKWELENQYSYS